ncbi:MAG: 4-alpha-glucanotransferase [Deltaproteobacteria bacterium]|nr:4-alpha-glucanotransferase [Deltaproteobacteria bacterium]
MPTALPRDLQTLARLYNVQTSYWDIYGEHRRSPVEGVLHVLKALGAPLERADDVSDALRERLQSLYRCFLDPVVVAWDGKLDDLKLRFAAKDAAQPIRYEVALEGGESRAGACEAMPLGRARAKVIEGIQYGSRLVRIPETLPFGYHRLWLSVGLQTREALLICAPRRAHGSPGEEHRTWGVFLPLYALRSEKSWGAGDFSDLERLLEWTGSLGGKAVGTLPLLAAFLDDGPFDPSPYSPASRLFWNEFYVDVRRIPEFARCPAAQALVGAENHSAEIGALRAAPLVDYRRLMALKRRVVEELCRYLYAEQSERASAFRRFVASHPQAEDYARFRAAVERAKKPWMEWAQPQRDGALEPGDYEEAVKRYHLYAQWVAQEQIQGVAERTAGGGAELYLDFPLGVHRAGYDVWREREAFAAEVSGGAPPDNFFTKGQNWGFPPLHPERLRASGYRHYIAALQHHLQFAGRIRIDHVMGLHRLYWIPPGLEAAEGVYVHYRPEEFYAILSLESHRHRALIIGENLGTVPPYVNAAMARHNIHGMHVGQFAVRTDSQPALQEIPRPTVASLNTHDTPTFAAFWRESDIEDRLELKLLDEAAAAREREKRCLQREALIAFLRSRGKMGDAAPDAQAALQAWLGHLAGEPAELVLVNLEDLWLETRPQNVPGTWNDCPNWRRKARYTFEEFSRMDSVREFLLQLTQQRKQAR